MLTIEDKPTIRHAILKRLDKEPGVTVLGVYARAFQDATGPDMIGVGIEALLRDTLIARSHFRLPAQFALGALHNEIDQVAEQLKAVWRDHTGSVRSDQTAAAQLAGTGLAIKDG